MIIQGCVAIVFGGARGIGRAYAEALIQHGAKVCVSDVLDTHGEKTVSELKVKYPNSEVFFYKCDVCSDKQVQDTFQETMNKYGAIQIVANNFGILHEFDWQKCMDVNLGGNIRVVNEARKRMGKNNGGGGGVVIVTASVSGLVPQAWGPVYAASKHAVIGYIRSWALDDNYKEHGIRMNTICPSRVKTAFLEQVLPGRVYHAEQHINMNEQAGHELKPEEVAAGLIQMIEDDSANGKTMRVTKQNGYDFAEFQQVPVQ